ncbi:MAG: iron-containing alcohol dehydrogenase [Candidatus Limiplasma sp.]|nr:iron-containing alcohol dehydrogenase [Candidatus Limiplasma sp.]
MNSFEFFNPVKVIFGAGEVARVGSEAAKLGRKALLVSYEDVSFYGGLPQRIRGWLGEHGVACVDAFLATANPTIAQARAGIEAGRREKVDLVIGLGGGSAMDLAKVIAAGILYPHDLMRMIKFTHSEAEYQIPPAQALPLLMVPTLPATSSEMNPTAVITDEATQRKSYVWEPACLYPRVSILDPALTVTLPPYQTACGALDAISHVVEPFFFSTQEAFGNLALHDAMQIGVIRAIYENIENVLANPGDLQLRGLMQWSATVGLNGWLTCGVQGWTPMHQMGHVISSHFHATHGATLACMMIAWMRFFTDHQENARFVKFAKLMYGAGDLAGAADQLEDFVKRVGVQSRLRDFGCTKADLDALVEGLVSVSFGPDGKLASIPKIGRGEARRIYELAL